MRTIDYPMDVSLSARIASPEDAPALARLMVAANDESLGLEKALGEVQEFACGSYGKPLWDCTFVAEINAELVSAVLSNDRGGAAWLASILTHPEYRKRGLATALIQRAIGAARALGYSTARLEVVSNNVAAIRLYERLGFAAA